MTLQMYIVMFVRKEDADEGYMEARFAERKLCLYFRENIRVKRKKEMYIQTVN